MRQVVPVTPLTMNALLEINPSGKGEHPFIKRALAFQRLKRMRSRHG